MAISAGAEGRNRGESLIEEIHIPVSNFEEVTGVNRN
jgi:hypothetical protein